jgi:hypothetical protein
MGTTTQEETSILLEPAFVQLKEGEPSYKAFVQENDQKFEVIDFCFAAGEKGETKILKIKSKLSPSMNNYDLSTIKKIEIKDQAYTSEKNENKVFTLVNIILNNDEIIKNLLFPVHLTICGIHEIKGMKASEKAWFISQVKQIDIEQREADDERPEPAKEDKDNEQKEPEEEEGVIETIKEAGIAAGKAAGKLAVKAGEVVVKAGEAAVEAVKQTGKYIKEAVK